MRAIALVVAAGAVCALTASAQERGARRVKEIGSPPATTATTPPAAMAGTSLADSRWWVDVTPGPEAKKAGKESFYDLFVFTKDTVTLTECLRHGFKPSPYSAEPVGADTTGTYQPGKADTAGKPGKPGASAKPIAMKHELILKTEQTSKTSGKTLWDARIRGDDIRGKLTWTTSDGKPLTFDFAGKRGTMLEGTTWTLNAQPANVDPEDEPDVHAVKMRFHRGELMLECREVEGFGACAYRLNARSGRTDLYTLEVKETNDSEEQLTIRADIHRDTLSGKIQLIDADGEPITELKLDGKKTLDVAMLPHRS